MSHNAIVTARYRTAVLDEGIVGLMAAHCRVSRQVQAEQILRWDYDHMTATYFLLLARKQVTSALCVLSSPSHIPGQVGKQYQHLLSSGDINPLPDLVVPAGAAAVGSGGKRAVLADQTANIANSPRGLVVGCFF